MRFVHNKLYRITYCKYLCHSPLLGEGCTPGVSLRGSVVGKCKCTSGGWSGQGQTGDDGRVDTGTIAVCVWEEKVCRWVCEMWGECTYLPPIHSLGKSWSVDVKWHPSTWTYTHKHNDARATVYIVQVDRGSPAKPKLRTWVESGTR